MSDFITKTYRALRRMVYFDGNILADQACPLHIGSAPSMRIYPEKELFRCRTCGSCLRPVELLWAVNPQDAINLAVDEGLLDPDQAETEQVRLQLASGSSKAFNGGRVYFDYLVRQGQTDIFGDASTLNSFDLPILGVRPETKIGPAVRFLVRSIRGVHGNLERYQFMWNTMMSSRVIQNQTPEPGRGFFHPRWVDFQPLDEVIIAANEHLGLAVMKAMRDWPAEFRRPVICVAIKSLENDLFYRSPFSRVWYVTDQPKQLSEAVTFCFGEKTEVVIKQVYSRAREDQIQELSDSGWIETGRLPSLAKHLAYQLQDRTSQEKGKILHPVFYRRNIPISVRQDLLKQISQEIGVSAGSLLESIDPIPGCFSVETRSGVLFCRHDIYYFRETRDAKLRPASNFSVRIIQRFMVKKTIYWTLNLIIQGKSQTFEVTDAVLDYPKRLWTKLKTVAAEAELPPPVLLRPRLKSELPKIIKISHSIHP